MLKRISSTKANIGFNIIK
uniref:Uncharacterized protein n=1 Tax=Anguilla anguilla TaxID=7936 RepID=A0A0E9VQD5_ANGAN